jgi:hypothetical protein
MNTEELKEVLYKLSVEFVKDNNTMMGLFTYQGLIDDLYYTASFRGIIENLQLFEANNAIVNGDKHTQAIFQLAPNYLSKEPEFKSAGMRDLKWKLLLPEAIDRVGNEDLFNDWKSINKEILDKLAISSVEIIYYKEESEITQAEFIESLKQDEY